MIYFDTSYLLKLYLDEHGSEEVRQLAASVDRLACAWHGQAQVITSFHRKLREAAIDSRQLTALIEQFLAESEAGAIVWLPLDNHVMDGLVRVVGTASAEMYLRAADGLHLSCAAQHGFEEVYANDRHLLTAAPLFGLRGTNVIPTR